MRPVGVLFRAQQEPVPGKGTIITQLVDDDRTQYIIPLVGLNYFCNAH